MKLSGVLDANVAIGLARGGLFDRLADAYDPLYVPPAVVREVTATPRPGALELSRALGSWLTEVAPASPLPPVSPTLSLADQEALALARERGVQHLLTGDAELRREALRYGLHCLGATDLVVLFKAVGLIPLVRPALDRMRTGGFGIEAARYDSALLAAGE